MLFRDIPKAVMNGPLSHIRRTAFTSISCLMKELTHVKRKVFLHLGQVTVPAIPIF